MIKSSKRETINASAAVLGHAGGTSTTRDDVTEYADKNTSKLTSFILYTIFLSLYTPVWTFHMFGDSKWFFVL